MSGAAGAERPLLDARVGIAVGRGLEPNVTPHNLEVEKSVLGAVLLDERHLDSLVIEVGLRAEHFYREQYGLVYAAMLDLRALDRKIGHLTVAETLRAAGQLERVGGVDALDELTRRFSRSESCSTPSSSSSTGARSPTARSPGLRPDSRISTS
jgi:DnaB-like helicase N terminal domain